MSNNVNDLLFDRANDMVEYWAGTQFEQRIVMAMKLKDLEQLEYIVRLAEGEQARYEMQVREAV